MRDYYKVLGVRPSATSPQIKAAYRSLTRQYHPDYNPGDVNAIAMSQMVNEAYEVLSDRNKRYAYDQMPRVDSENSEVAANTERVLSKTVVASESRPPWYKVFWWSLRDLASYRTSAVIAAMIYAGMVYQFGFFKSLLTFCFVLILFQSDVLAFLLLWFLPEAVIAWSHLCLK